MDVEQSGTLDNGLPVFMDTCADRVDGVFVINQITAHTDFTGLHGSGLAKRLLIGLGKQYGTEGCHGLGFGWVVELISALPVSSLSTRLLSLVGWTL